MVKVINDAFSIDIADFLNETLLQGPMYVHNSKGPVDYANHFFNFTFNLDDHFIRFICQKLLKHSPFEKIHILRCYANIQFQNQSGSWHTDDGDLTFLWMISPTLNPGDGCFQIKDGETIDFVKNRLIIFDAKQEHKGNHSVQSQPRISFAIKTKIIK